MSEATIRTLLHFVARLREKHIHYVLADPTEGALMVEIAVPGERWEVEFHEDGRINVEVFVSSKGVQPGDVILDELFRRFGD